LLSNECKSSACDFVIDKIKPRKWNQAHLANRMDASVSILEKGKAQNVLRGGGRVAQTMQFSLSGKLESFHR
jgi:hypothetical protein